MSMARYLVGIDLGTTHTVVAYADLHSVAAEARARPELFEIEQLVALGELAPRPLLPSMRYHPAAGELAEDDISLPWPPPDIGLRLAPSVIGELAQELGSKTPGRLVSSAKSWLSHRGVDRTEPILPWGAPEDVQKISPLHASASYLAHVRSAWNRRFPEHLLQAQEIVLTVPASFDEGARALTVQAAQLAGLARVHLVEEPQAACYDWLARRSDRLDEALGDMKLLLVCDVGGGTTDFTLIQASRGEKGPELKRIAVGDHLMLGGDNMDLALAHLAEGRIVKSGARLSAADLSQLMQQCRRAKERLLASDAPESAAVTVLGAGARVVGGARSAELSRDEVRQALVEGFYPASALDETPRRVRTGIVEFGLPYVSDPAVTRHLALFLARHADACREAAQDAERSVPAPGMPAVPDAVLLNGGVFRSPLLSGRILQVLSEWRGAPVRSLDNAEPHLAVARGAVAYGLAKRGHGVKIGGGSPRSYFLVLEAEPGKARRGICILPRGSEEGQEVRLPERTFSLRVGQPARFHLVSSLGDKAFKQGELAEINESFRDLPPIAAVLPAHSAADEVPVQLASSLSEVGTLEMSCVAVADPSKRWQLQFQLRHFGKHAAASAGGLHPRFDEAAARIERIYGARSRTVEPRDVRNLRRELEAILSDREKWDSALLREIFGALWDGVRRRRRSPDHERVWFNLAGYSLRPGFGSPLDDWRVQLLWSIYEQGVQYAADARVWSEWWILWRRVSGGLDRYAQQRIASDLAYDLQPPSRQGKRPPGPKKQGYDDMVRLAGSLERLAVETKAALGRDLIERLRKPSESIETWWAVGRLGARVPFYGSSHQVVGPDVAEEWLAALLALDWREVGTAPFAATLIARVSGDRERDLDPQRRERVADQLRHANAPANWVRMVEELTELEEADEKRIFGESLPPGLRMIE
jgi:molecular chaperone DnaK (HSP70)